MTYLLKNTHQPASLQATDSLGNTVLHALVMIADNSPENSMLVTHMYDRLLQVGGLQLEDMTNLQGLTPLKLAAKEGKIEVSGQATLSRKQEDSARNFAERAWGGVVGLLLRRCSGKGLHLAMTGEPRGFSRVVVRPASS